MLVDLSDTSCAWRCRVQACGLLWKAGACKLMRPLFESVQSSWLDPNLCCAALLTLCAHHPEAVRDIHQPSIHHPSINFLFWSLTSMNYFASINYVSTLLLIMYQPSNLMNIYQLSISVSINYVSPMSGWQS